MNLEQLKASGKIFFECVSGSHAYGLSTPKSDVDIRGFFYHSNNDYLGLVDPPQQVGDKKNDITYYSLKRSFELLMTANPNIIELLWMPEDCVKSKTPLMEKLIENRDLFISKKCFYTHSGYAYAQIKKATGQNKKVNNPQPEERPKKENFCWIIRTVDPNVEPCNNCDGSLWSSWSLQSEFPCRPIPLGQTGIDLSKWHVAAVEHISNTYRMYYYGENAKGVFRGDDMLVCESIPKEDENSKFQGSLLVYNKHEYEKALKDHKSYWDWMKNRNENRWVDQEKGKLHYDQKNLMHCMRLLMSGENILNAGFPIVRFEGSNRDYLMSIRNGEMKYEDIMAEVEKRMANLQKLYNNPDKIPHSVNMKKITGLYRDLRNSLGD